MLSSFLSFKLSIAIESPAPIELKLIVNFVFVATPKRLIVCLPKVLSNLTAIETILSPPPSIFISIVGSLQDITSYSKT